MLDSVPSATYTLPAASTATSTGFSKSDSNVLVRAAAGDLYDLSIFVVATKTSPLASRARPLGVTTVAKAVAGPPPIGTLTTRLWPVSLTYKSPGGVRATANGALSVNGATLTTVGAPPVGAILKSDYCRYPRCTNFRLIHAGALQVRF